MYFITFIHLLSWLFHYKNKSTQTSHQSIKKSANNHYIWLKTNSVFNFNKMNLNQFIHKIEIPFIIQQ